MIVLIKRVKIGQLSSDVGPINKWYIISPNQNTTPLIEFQSKRESRYVCVRLRVYNVNLTCVGHHICLNHERWLHSSAWFSSLSQGPGWSALLYLVKPCLIMAINGWHVNALLLRSVQQMHTARQLEYYLIEIGSFHFRMQIKENGLFYLVIKLTDVVVKCDGKRFVQNDVQSKKEIYSKPAEIFNQCWLKRFACLRSLE